VVKTKEKEEVALGPGVDELQSVLDKGLQAVRPHAKVIGIGLAAVIVAVAAGSIWSSMQDKKAGRASAELGKVLDAASARVEAGAPDLEAMVAGREPEAARFKTFKERSEAEVAAAQALDASYGGTAVAKRGKLVAAGALYDLGKYDDAAAAYRAFLDGKPGDDLAAVAQEGLGYALEAKALAQTDASARSAGLDEAGKAFAALAPASDKDGKSPQAANALYHQGRILAAKGDKAGAIDAWKKVLDKNPGPLLTEEVNARLALLDAAGAAAPAAPAPK
jgi:predicted negative regulator of RcsB-dependent stress response